MSSMADQFHQLSASIISQLTALLQLKYQTERQSPFATLPSTMCVAISGIMLCYLLNVGILQSPTSRFAAVARLITVCCAYAAVTTLAAALFPHRATPTIFGLLAAGQLVYVHLGEKLTIGDEEGDASVIEAWKRKVGSVFKNMCSSVAEFFCPAAS